MIKTIAIQIGNSDDKLSQRVWSVFCQDIYRAIVFHTFEGGHIHFWGFSNPDELWQNCCGVFTIDSRNIEPLKRRIGALRDQYNQDSVAYLEGFGEFI